MTTQSLLPPPPAIGHNLALFLDFDGTLAAIQDEASTVALPPTLDQTLLQLSRKLSGALALVSGRDVRDLSSRVPNDLWRAGGHGVEICRPMEAPAEDRVLAPTGMVDDLEALASGHDGTFLERKDPVLALHYRANPDAGATLEAAMAEIVATYEDYRLQHGKMVLEAKPSAANKGRALRQLMAEDPFRDRIPVMVGDDKTDEDAMAVAEELGGYGIMVGADSPVARFHLCDVAAVHAWLAEGVKT